MIGTILPKALVISALFMFNNDSMAQSKPGPTPEKPGIEKTVKPFKILTSGKRITIQSKSSTNSIKKIIVWTSTGHRFVEQYDLAVSSYDFTIPGNEKIFFMMLEMNNGKRYTDKFGVQ